MLVLYTTLGCHLCEKAKQEIYTALGYDQAITERDIADDDALMEAYALKIPVLAWCDPVSGKENAEQLNWPFDSELVVAWYQGLK